MLPYTFLNSRAVGYIYAPPIRINCAERRRKYVPKDIGARYYDANERSMCGGIHVSRPSVSASSDSRTSNGADTFVSREIRMI